MPLYEYLCDACGHRFEVIHKFSDPRRDTCPECGGIVHKMQSAPAFQLKGTGWYLTDYAKQGQAGPAKAAPGDKEPSKDAATSGAKESAASASAETTSGGQSDSKKTSASDKPSTKSKGEGTTQS
jgi:putative FmdB family regulatory protein